ncbi:hypothetical protein QGP82_25560 [Leptothoe sp. LEGE 181152]|nr:hypothetical protein [Leptothoe sp. LEGE 181152]
MTGNVQSVATIQRTGAYVITQGVTTATFHSMRKMRSTLPLVMLKTVQNAKVLVFSGGAQSVERSYPHFIQMRKSNYGAFNYADG